MFKQRSVEDVQQTEEQDLWISSVELAVIKSARERFLSDWKRTISSVDRINELEKGKPIEQELLEIIMKQLRFTNH